MGKQEVIDYVMTTPSNPNRAVLSGMLDDVANAGGGGTPLIVAYSEIEEECPSDSSKTITKVTCSHSWQEIYDALVSGQPAYLKNSWQIEDEFVVELLPITSASTDNSTMYNVETTDKGTNIHFPNATDKEWTIGTCE